VILLTRISGQPFLLNCDLIERVDVTPDTVVSLVDGKKYVVLESSLEVMAAIRRHRSEIIALSHWLQPDEIEESAEPAQVARLTRVAPLDEDA
jgi:flagellar protein FlbD